MDTNCFVKGKKMYKIILLSMFVLISGCSNPTYFSCEWKIPYICSWDSKK